MAAEDSRLRDLCAHVHEDDGRDARRQDRKTGGAPHAGAHRDGQLLKIARRAIEQEVCANAGGIGWRAEVLEIEVGAGPHVRAWVGVACPRPHADDAQAWLSARAGAVRAALARSLARKRTPTVTLVVQWVREVSHGY